MSDNGRHAGWFCNLQSECIQRLCYIFLLTPRFVKISPGKDISCHEGCPECNFGETLMQVIREYSKLFGVGHCADIIAVKQVKLLAKHSIVAVSYTL